MRSLLLLESNGRLNWLLICIPGRLFLFELANCLRNVWTHSDWLLLLIINDELRLRLRFEHASALRRCSLECLELLRLTVRLITTLMLRCVHLVVIKRDQVKDGFSIWSQHALHLQACLSLWWINLTHVLHYVLQDRAVLRSLSILIFWAHPLLQFILQKVQIDFSMLCRVDILKIVQCPSLQHRQPNRKRFWNYRISIVLEAASWNQRHLLRRKECFLFLERSLIKISLFIRPGKWISNLDMAFLVDENVVRPYISNLGIDFCKILRCTH